VKNKKNRTNKFPIWTLGYLIVKWVTSCGGLGTGLSKSTIYGNDDDFDIGLRCILYCREACQTCNSVVVFVTIRLYNHVHIITLFAIRIPP